MMNVGMARNCPKASCTDVVTCWNCRRRRPGAPGVLEDVIDNVSLRVARGDATQALAAARAYAVRRTGARLTKP
jgi:hypothetical protein